MLKLLTKLHVDFTEREIADEQIGKTCKIYSRRGCGWVTASARRGELINYLRDLPLLGTAKLGKADRKEEWLAIGAYHYSSSITACFIVLFNLGYAHAR